MAVVSLLLRVSLGAFSCLGTSSFLWVLKENFGWKNSFKLPCFGWVKREEGVISDFPVLTYLKTLKFLSKVLLWASFLVKQLCVMTAAVAQSSSSRSSIRSFLMPSLLGRWWSRSVQPSANVTTWKPF